MATIVKSGKNDKVTTTIRMGKDLHFKLVKLTQKENRSFSNLVETRLFQSISDEELV